MSESRGAPAIRILIGGDLYVNRPDPKSIFEHLAETLRSADIAIVNQEVPLADGGTPWASKSSMKLRSPTKSVEALTYAGVDAVTLATNHTLDFGYEALSECLSVLDAAGIAHAGAGADVEAAHAPVILERNGTRVALLDYCSVFTPGYEATADRPGLAAVRADTTYALPRRAQEMPGSPAVVTTTPDPDDVARLEADIRAAHQRAEVVIVLWHWGVSGGYAPSGAYQHLVPYQIELAHRAIDAGANLLVGHGPHCLQGVEVYQGRVICYSIGQIGFDMHSATHRKETALLEAVVGDGKISEVYLLPALARGDGSAALVSGAEATRVVEEIRRLCEPLGTELTAVDTRLRVDAEMPAAGAQGDV